MAIDMYDTRVMLPALEQIPRPRTFLLDTFFKNVRKSDSEYIDIDMVKRKRRVAVYVKPIEQGHVVDKGGFETKTYKAPYIKEKMKTTAGDIMRRAAGENVYSASTPQQRFAARLREELTELDDMITRAEEIQACQAMFTGKVVAKNEKGEAIQQVDFLLPASHNVVLSGTDLWSDAAFKKNALLKQLRDNRRLLVKDSGRAPTDLILGSDAMDKFIDILDPDSTTAGLSSMRVERGQLDISNLPSGVTYLGYFKELGVDVWSYDEWYHNGSADVAMLDPKKVWLGSRNARFDRNYAAIQDLDALFAVERFPKSWTQDDPSARFLMLQSAPLMAPHEVDSFYVAQVLA
ncbi:MAG: major capsid protein [Spirochaetes bacterium]|nr:major capsid protein [Spirochaetota bacterium]